MQRREHAPNPTVRARGRRPALGLLTALALVGCEGYAGYDDDIVGPGDRSQRAPTLTEARAVWVEEFWRGTQPVGHPAVELTWELPERWTGEVFRVYARPTGNASYSLAATVTSCAERVCRYTDLNVTTGRAYDYYVAALDERSGRELGASAARQVRVPSFTRPDPPSSPSARALDGAVFLQWQSTGAERYRIFLERIGTDSAFFELGSTDGTSFVDTRARNGTRYAYRIAAVDTLGGVSARSALATATPRPDYHAELIYAFADSAAASGFRFVSTQDDSPIVAGSAPGAQWRLEAGPSGLRVVPLGQTGVTPGTFTTALTCGPGSEPDCESVDRAPAASAFGGSPVAVETGNTYVFRVVGADGRTRYGKVRVQGRSTDAQGRALVVFDWAYQLVPDEPSLSKVRG